MQTTNACDEPLFDRPLDRYDAVDFEYLLELVSNMCARYAHASGFHSIQLTHNADPTIHLLSKITKLALIHSEVSEVLEAIRKPHADNPSHNQSATIPDFTQEEEEIADTVIRLLDYAVTYHIKLAPAILAKMAYNRTRPTLHGGKRA